MPVVLVWLAQGLVSGIGSGGSAWIMGRVLAAIFGAQTDPQLAAALSTIQDELGVLTNLVKAVIEGIASLAQQLSLSTKVLEGYVEQAQISDDIAAIEQHFTEMQDMLSGATSKSASGGPKAFADHVLGAWDIPARVRAISDALVGGEGLEKGLLETWTEYLILQLGTSPAPGDLESAALMLQQLFRQQLNHQFRGVVLICSAKSVDCDPNQKCQPALDYLKLYQDLLAKQLECYLECVEKLVLSQFNLVSAVPSVIFPAEAATILRNADLFLAVANDQPGIGGRKLVPPGLLQNGSKGPVLQPTSDYTPSSGQAVATGSGYKCADWDATDKSQSSLLDWNKSDFGIVRYQWPWPKVQPQPGKPVNPQFESGVTPYYYDKKTLERVDSPPKPEDVILFADFADTSAVLSSLDLVERPWSPATAVSTEQTNIRVFADVAPRNKLPNGASSGPQALVLAAQALNWNSVNPDGYTYVLEQSFSFAYHGSRSTQANILISGSLSCQNADSLISLLRNCRVSINWQTDGTTQALYDSGLLQQSFTHGVSAAAKVQLQPQKQVTLACRLEAQVAGQRYGNILPPQAGAQLQFVLNCLRLAWDLAAVTP